jgi:DNA-binding transcriptional ArsR family regulator
MGAMDDSVLYERRARICQVLADPKRLRLIDALRGGMERSVGELAGLLGATCPKISQHLNVMREAGAAGRRACPGRRAHGRAPGPR